MIICQIQIQNFIITPPQPPNLSLKMEKPFCHCINNLHLPITLAAQPSFDALTSISQHNLKRPQPTTQIHGPSPFDAIPVSWKVFVKVVLFFNGNLTVLKVIYDLALCTNDLQRESKSTPYDSKVIFQPIESKN